MSSSSNVKDLLRKLARPTQKVGKTHVKLAWCCRESSKRGIKLTDTECYDWLSSKIGEAYEDEQGRRRALVQREWSRARQSGWRQDVLSE